MRKAQELINKFESVDSQDDRLISLLKLKAEISPEDRESALHTIQEIQNLGNQRRAILAKGRSELPDVVTIRSNRKLAVVACLLWFVLLVLGHYFEMPLNAVIFFGLGILAFGHASLLHYSKINIFRKYGKRIEFEKEPSAYTSTIIASAVIGCIFFYCAYVMI